MKKIFTLLLFIPVIFLGCNSNDPAGQDTADFDRKVMLKNWADNIIIPAFTSFSSHTAELKAGTENFTSNPTQQTLDTLRSAWLNAYLAFQNISMFEFGKAMEVRFRDNLNIYPVDTTELHQNIEEGDYNLELPSLIDSQGFPALDYLLYGLAENDSEILSFYTTNPRSQAYRNYLMDLSDRIDSLTREVLSGWNSAYRNEFVNNSGNGANSSVDMMVNDYIQYYEKPLRAGKIGIPAGVFSGSPLQTHVEGYYSKEFSKNLLLEALTAARNFFNGKHFESDETGESLKSYLDYLNTMKNGTDLSALINAQFEKARAEIMTLNDDLSRQVESDNSKMLAAYDQLQKNVIYLKVDMLQALNISVDYIDADGD